jgi:hypothetical protein
MWALIKESKAKTPLVPIMRLLEVYECDLASKHMLDSKRASKGASSDF